MLVTGFKACKLLKTIELGGEQLTPAAVRDIYAVLPNASIFNVYGPTEATVQSTRSKAMPKVSSACLLSVTLIYSKYGKCDCDC
jgi:non-ribosomal peptide synthetase component F